MSSASSSQCKSKADTKLCVVKNSTKEKEAALNAYFVFMEEFYETYKKDHPMNNSLDAIEEAGFEKWGSLSESEKAPYISEADKRKADIKRSLVKNPTKARKAAPTGFVVFMEEFREAYMYVYPKNKSLYAIGVAGLDKWKLLSDSEKAPYESEADRRNATTDGGDRFSVQVPTKASKAARSAFSLFMVEYRKDHPEFKVKYEKKLEYEEEESDQPLSEVMRKKMKICEE